MPAPIEEPVDQPVLELTTTRASQPTPWGNDTSHTHSSEIFKPQAVENVCEKVLESATIDWEFQWPDGLLKSWHMIRAQSSGG
mmetsp:Transcript_3995/g.7253  ORF Transcript_3995/g.7253 Transcript_3995/m.7253 type:complete len:83 (-) Transcript_3995:250-498(-)